MSEIADNIHMKRMAEYEKVMRNAGEEEEVITEFLARKDIEYAEKSLQDKEEEEEEKEGWSRYKGVYELAKDYWHGIAIKTIDEKAYKIFSEEGQPEGFFGEKPEFLDTFYKTGVGASLWDDAKKYHTGKAAVEDKYGGGANFPNPDLYTDQGWGERIFEKGVTFAYDMPAYLIGAGVTAAATFVTGAGAPAALNPTWLATGSGFLTDATREMYYQALVREEVNTPQEFWEIFMESAIYEGGKGALTLGTTVALPRAFGLTGWKRFGSAGATLATIPALLEGRLPKKTELTDAYALLFMAGIGVKSGKMLIDAARATGKRADQTARRVLRDTSMQEDHHSINKKIYRVDEKKVKNWQRSRARVGTERAAPKPRRKPISARASTGFGPADAINRRIYNEPTGWLARFNEMRHGKPIKHWFLEEFIDAKHPFLRDVRKFKKAGGIFDGNNNYESFRILPGSLGRGMSFINGDTLHFNLGPRGKGMKQILEEANITKDVKIAGMHLAKVFDNVKYNQLIAYHIARRVLEQHKKGFKTGFDIKEARATVNWGKARWEKTSQALTKHSQEVLDYARQAGAFSEAQLSAILEVNKNYAAFERLLDFQERARGTTSQYRSLVQKFKGSDAPIADPITTQYHNTIRIIQAVDQMVALREYIDMTQTIKGLFPEIKRVKGIKKITLSAEKLSELVNDPKKLSQAQKEGLAIFTTDYLTKGLKEGQVRVLRNGKTEVWDIGKDRGIAIGDLNLWKKQLWIKFFGAPARLLRAGATLDPIFMLKNVSRDTFQGAAFSHNEFIPVYHTIVGLFQMIGSPELGKMYASSGAMQSFLNTFDRNYVKATMRRELQSTRWHNRIAHPIETLRILGDLTETAPRMADFKMSLERLLRENKVREKKGLKPLTRRQVIERAGFEARKLTIDFAKMGSSTAFINSLTPFYAARINGIVRIIEEFRERPQQVSRKIFQWIIAPAILYWAINRDWEYDEKTGKWSSTRTEEFNNISKIERQQNWIIFTGDPANPGRRIPWKIPKSHELGFLFATGTEDILDYMFEKDPEKIDDFMIDLLLNTGSGLAPMPQVIRPFWDNMTNQHHFTKKPVIPAHAQSKVRQERYTPWTSTWARVLGATLEEIGGKSLGFSPAHIDNVWRGWTGGLGKYFSNIVDYLLELSDIPQDMLGEEYAQDPEKFWNEIPVLSSFSTRYPSSNNSWTVKFWELYKPLKEHLETIEGIENEKIAKVRKQERIKKLKADPIMKNKPLNRAYKQISKLYGRIRDLYNIGENTNAFTPAEQRQQIDIIWAQILTISEKAVRIYGEQRKGHPKKGLETFQTIQDLLPSLYK